MSSGNGVLLVGEWRIDAQAGAASRDDESVRLEPKAVEVLSYLASRPGEVVSRAELEASVWPGAVVGYEAVTKTIIKLRKALGDSAREPRYIETIPKRGYRLIAEVGVVEQALAEPVAAGLAPRAVPDGTKARGRARAVGAVLLVLSLVAVIALFVGGRRPIEQPQETMPAIIVLPFENLGEPPEYDAFADGMTEDLITDLSRIAPLQVLASNTAFTFKGKPVSAQALAEQLDVDFVLQGSIRRHDGGLRMNVRLVDARTGYQRWADRYDRDAGDVFAVQDEIAHSIVAALAIRLSPQEAQRLASRTTDSLAAYDHFIEGQQFSRLSTRDANLLAEQAYREAIAEDPGFSRAYGALAYTLAFRYRRGWTDSPVFTIDLALDLALKAVALNDAVPQAYWALGYVHLMRREHAQADRAATRAIEIAPSYADGYGLLALIKNALAEPDAAIELIRKGMRLNPFYTWDYPYNLGRAYYTAGDLETAIRYLEEARARNPNALPIRVHLAASYAAAGRQGDAEWEIEEVKALSPDESISLLEATHPVRDAQAMQRLVADLRRAGLPE
jgi:TolB-like protein/DNA-binding winged helix-turn-helix (wHTH) protein/Tfp pilus assembly protein PilF